MYSIFLNKKKTMKDFYKFIETRPIEFPQHVKSSSPNTIVKGETLWPLLKFYILETRITHDDKDVVSIEGYGVLRFIALVTNRPRPLSRNSIVVAFSGFVVNIIRYTLKNIIRPPEWWVENGRG